MHIRTWLASALVLFITFGIALGAAGTGSWEQVPSEHFVVKHQGRQALAQNVSVRAEAEYERMRKELGFIKVNDLWIGNSRVKVWLYNTKEAYVSERNAPEWSAGNASYSTREIAVVAGKDDAVSVSIVHEIGHLVFMDSLGWFYRCPAWINEGITQWLESDDRRKTAAETMKAMSKEGKLMPFKDLMAVQSSSTLEDAKVKVFYAESVSVVDYLLRTYGAERFKRLCTHIRNNMRLEDAVKFTYLPEVRNLDELEKAWKASIGG